jgi:hypothetical protein
MANRLNRLDRYRKEATRLMALAKFATSPRVRARYLNFAERYEALARSEPHERAWPIRPFCGEVAVLMAVARTDGLVHGIKHDRYRLIVRRDGAALPPCQCEVKHLSRAI